MGFVIFWMICGIVTALIASGRGKSGWGWFLIGFLLGPLGLILALVTTPNTKVVEGQAIVSGQQKKCPYCAELIKVEAIKCKHCGSSLVENEYNEKKDAWEGSFWDVELPKSVKATLQLDYVDGDGNNTQRIVDVRQFGIYFGGTLIIGHCRLRNATRTFRIDRVKYCVDVNTGEVIQDIHKHLLQIYESSPEYKMSSFLEEEYDSIRVLFYVGKADGRLTSNEINIIAETCRKLSNESIITDEIVKKAVSEFDVPSQQAFKMAVSRLSKRGKSHMLIIKSAAELIVGTQKTVHPAEKEAIEYIEKRANEAVDVPNDEFKFNELDSDELKNEEKPKIFALAADPTRPDISKAKCGNCDKVMTYASRMSGRNVNCPDCKQAFALP